MVLATLFLSRSRVLFNLEMSYLKHGIRSDLHLNLLNLNESSVCSAFLVLVWKLIVTSSFKIKPLVLQVV